MAAARGSRCGAARRRLGGLAAPCFRCFTAYDAMPSHLALQFGRGPYSITALSCVVRHSKIGCPTSELGRVSRVSPVHTAIRNCTRDEGGPFEVGSQVLVSSHRKLLSSKAMVVSVAETPGLDFGRQD